MGEAKCQPCNHRNHKPSYVLRFSGKAYHKATLEEVEEEKDSEDEEEEEDSEEEEDKASVNSQGQKLPSQERTWCSGKYVFLLPFSDNLTNNTSQRLCVQCRTSSYPHPLALPS